MSKLKWTKFEIIRLRTIFILTLPFAFILSILRVRNKLVFYNVSYVHET